MDWTALGRWILDRSEEKSTWAGICFILSTFGAKMSPAYADTIQMLGTSVASGLLVAMKERK